MYQSGDGYDYHRADSRSGYDGSPLSLYRQDIIKYAQGLMSLKIRQIFDSIPSQLDDKNRRFMLNRLGKGQQMRGLESSFLWLEEAGVALYNYCISLYISHYALRALF